MTFHRLLKVGGHLFLGHAESIPPIGSGSKGGFTWGRESTKS